MEKLDVLRRRAAGGNVEFKHRRNEQGGGRIAVHGDRDEGGGAVAGLQERRNDVERGDWGEDRRPPNSLRRIAAAEREKQSEPAAEHERREGKELLIEA